jgi:type VI secretion system secreted protein VgrG
MMSPVAAVTGHFLLQGEPIPADALAVRFRAIERISHPYEVVVEFSTADTTFDVASCLRQQHTLHVVDARGNARVFDGVADQVAFIDVVAERLFFRVRLRPALAALTHRKNSRIFQEKNIIAVAQTIFEDAGFGDKVEFVHTKEYQPREFIVQYRESDFAFVSRLFEEYGLFYWFGHSADGHKMIVGDDASVFAAHDETPPTFFSMTQGVGVGADPLEIFSRKKALRTNHVHLLDYDFEKPQAAPSAEQPGEDAVPAPYYEYPGGFTKSAVGSQLANARMRSLRRDSDVVRGQSKAIGLRCGVPFVVEGSAELDLNGTFVVTDLVTTGKQNTDDGSVACENEFRGIPEGAAFAPARTTPRPRIHGVQTAIVTGSSEQEQTIHVDEYGRIKVRFYWDREGQQDHTSSCWIRVSQVGMGGAIILPRVGWEVSVAFVEGDPDRPLVLGRVYNAEKTPPMTLPGAKTSGALKSWSSPGAGGFNEINVGDSGGSQGFNMHAQKDLNITVENDKNETVAVDEEHHVSVNESTSVGANETISVGGNQAVDVGASLTQNVGGSQSIDIGGNDTSNATHNFVEKIDGDRAYSIGGKQITIENGIRYEVGGSASRSVSSLQLNGSIASIKEKVTGDYTHNTGAVTVHLVVGSHGESIVGSKNQTSIAAELHMTKANLEQSCQASVTNMVGGLHYQKLDGDLVIKAPMVTMLGAIGILKGGGSELKLGGGPVVGKGKKIKVEGAMIIKMGGQLKMA